MPISKSQCLIRNGVYAFPIVPFDRRSNWTVVEFNKIRATTSKHVVHGVNQSADGSINVEQMFHAIYTIYWNVDPSPILERAIQLAIRKDTVSIEVGVVLTGFEDQSDFQYPRTKTLVQMSE